MSEYHLSITEPSSSHCRLSAVSLRYLQAHLADICCRYGYRYPCMLPGGAHNVTAGRSGKLADDKRDICQLKPVPFRGAPCSDAAGQQLCFKDVMRLLQETGSQAQWDATQQAPSFSFKDSSAPGKLCLDLTPATSSTPHRPSPLSLPNTQGRGGRSTQRAMGFQLTTSRLPRPDFQS